MLSVDHVSAILHPANAGDIWRYSRNVLSSNTNFAIIWFMCKSCQKKVAAYNFSRYRNDPKPWPKKTLCRVCRADIRENRRVWRRAYVERHRDAVNAAQRDYRRRLKKAV